MLWANLVVFHLSLLVASVLADTPHDPYRLFHRHRRRTFSLSGRVAPDGPASNASSSGPYAPLARSTREELIKVEQVATPSSKTVVIITDTVMAIRTSHTHTRHKSDHGHLIKVITKTVTASPTGPVHSTSDAKHEEAVKSSRTGTGDQVADSWLSTMSMTRALAPVSAVSAAMSLLAEGAIPITIVTGSGVGDPQEWVDAHNYFRMQYGAPNVTWNASLVGAAAMNAAKCVVADE